MAAECTSRILGSNAQALKLGIQESNGEKKLEQTASWNTENLNEKLRTTRFSLSLYQPRSDFQAPIYSNFSPQKVLWQVMKIIKKKIFFFPLRKRCCLLLYYILTWEFFPHPKVTTLYWERGSYREISDLFHISKDNSLGKRHQIFQFAFWTSRYHINRKRGWKSGLCLLGRQKSHHPAGHVDRENLEQE